MSLTLLLRLTPWAAAAIAGLWLVDLIGDARDLRRDLDACRAQTQAVRDVISARDGARDAPDTDLRDLLGMPAPAGGLQP
jgi:hypothetical protein